MEKLTQGVWMVRIAAIASIILPTAVDLNGSHPPTAGCLVLLSFGEAASH